MSLYRSQCRSPRIIKVTVKSVWCFGRDRGSPGVVSLRLVCPPGSEKVDRLLDDSSGKVTVGDVGSPDTDVSVH